MPSCFLFSNIVFISIILLRSSFCSFENQWFWAKQGRVSRPVFPQHRLFGVLVPPWCPCFGCWTAVGTRADLLKLFDIPLAASCVVFKCNFLLSLLSLPMCPVILPFQLFLPTKHEQRHLRCSSSWELGAEVLLWLDFTRQLCVLCVACFSAAASSSISAALLSLSGTSLCVTYKPVHGSESTGLSFMRLQSLSWAKNQCSTLWPFFSGELRGRDGQDVVWGGEGKGKLWFEVLQCQRGFSFWCLGCTGCCKFHVFPVGEWISAHRTCDNLFFCLFRKWFTNWTRIKWISVYI